MDRGSSLPTKREVFLDARGGDRALSVTWHSEAALLVLSLWRGRCCVGTFRMPVKDVPSLVQVLRASLDDAYEGARGSLAQESVAGSVPAAEEKHVG